MNCDIHAGEGQVRPQFYFAHPRNTCPHNICFLQWEKFTALPLGVGQWNNQLDSLQQALRYLKDEVGQAQEIKDPDTRESLGFPGEAIAAAGLLSTFRAGKSRANRSERLLVNFYRYTGRHAAAEMNPAAAAVRDRLWERWCGIDSARSNDSAEKAFAFCAQWDGNATQENLVRGYRQMADFQFILSPPGIGLDTYR
jgi:hypothetical protein